MARSEAPLGKAEVWPMLIEYARKHDLAIDTHFAKKIYWMEAHKGVCFCSWDSGRMCPCSEIENDFERYNGSCLCGPLCTHKHLETVTKRRNKKRGND